MESKKYQWFPGNKIVAHNLLWLMRCIWKATQKMRVLYISREGRVTEDMLWRLTILIIDVTLSGDCKRYPWLLW